MNPDGWGGRDLSALDLSDQSVAWPTGRNGNQSNGYGKPYNRQRHIFHVAKVQVR